MNSVDRLLILAPRGRDAQVIMGQLTIGGTPSCIAGPGEIVAAIRAGELGAAIIADEALPLFDLPGLAQALAAQPPWSDCPFLLLTQADSVGWSRGRITTLLGNVTILERPLRSDALISAARSAMRARQRQRRAQAYLREREEAEAQVRELAGTLEARVLVRTRALSEASSRVQQLQAELIHVSRVSAMGTMASTLAHELNQPLTAIVNYVRGSRRMLAGVREISHVRDALDEADRSAVRAGEIVRRVRGMVAKGNDDRRIEDLSTLVREACDIAMIDARSAGISYKLELDPRSTDVLVDRIQIQQVLINLLRNSVEALAQTPVRRIVVATSRPSNGLSKVSVRDTGSGISTTVASRLFEPFNTNKSAGMGVGLSISRTIIEAHGGRIWNEGHDCGGTVFSFTVPTADRESLVEAAAV